MDRLDKDIAEMNEQQAEEIRRSGDCEGCGNPEFMCTCELDSQFN